MGGRGGYWFPLVLLGFGLLVLLGWHSVPTGDDFGWFAYAPSSSVGEGQLTGTTFVSSVDYVPMSAPRDWSWLVLITATFVGMVAWYAVRARRAGGSVRGHVGLAVVGGIAVPVCFLIAGAADAATGPVERITPEGLSLLGLGVVAGALAYFRRDRWRRTMTAVSVVSLVAGVGTVLGTWWPGLLEPVLITAGLLVLARYERSRLLAVVAGAVFLTLVVFPEGTMGMLLPAMVVLAAAVVTLVRRDSASPPAAGRSS